jgi:hypothetical protein
MDFEKPLSKVEGYLVYTTMLDYLETFVHEYTVEKKGQYPSLRMTTDMLLNLLVDVRKLELSDLSAATITDALYEFESKLMRQAEKPSNEIFDSRKAGLFTEGPGFKGWKTDDEGGFPTPRDYVRQSEVDEPLKPFKLTSKDDKDWLRKCGISPEEKQ